MDKQLEKYIKQSKKNQILIRASFIKMMNKRGYTATAVADGLVDSLKEYFNE